MAYEKAPNDDSIGVLWIKESPRGEYLSGTILGEKVVVFRNKKTNDRQPDWKVLKAKARDPEPKPAEPVTVYDAADELGF